MCQCPLRLVPPGTLTKPVYPLKKPLFTDPSGFPDPSGLLTPLALISTQTPGCGSKAWGNRVNALAGFYFIVTNKTSELKFVFEMCQCPLGLILHFYAPQQFILLNLEKVSMPCRLILHFYRRKREEENRRHRSVSMPSRAGATGDTN